MRRKILPVNRALQTAGEYLEEARLKRCVSIKQLASNLKLTEEDILNIENGNSDINFFSFTAYIFYFRLDTAIFLLLKNNFQHIIFELNGQIKVRASTNHLRFVRKLISYLVIIRKISKLTKFTVSERSGLDIATINLLETLQDVRLVDFFAYCFALHALKPIVEALSFRYDEFGNKIIVAKLRNKELFDYD